MIYMLFFGLNKFLDKEFFEPKKCLFHKNFCSKNLSGPNMSLQLGLKPSKKFLWLVFCLFYTSPVVVLVWLESNFIANSAKLDLDLG